MSNMATPSSAQDSSQGAAPQGATPQGAAPQGAAPQGTAPQVPAPGQAVPSDPNTVDGSAGHEDEDGDVDMNADRVQTKVYKLGKDLPRELLSEIDHIDAELYTDSLSVGDPDTNSEAMIPTTGFFDYRGRDVNKAMLPQGLDGGQKLRTSVWFTEDLTIVGQHLQLSADDAEAMEVDKDPRKIEPPVGECVKVKFHLDTQNPHIELSTINPATRGVIATRIFAHEIEWNWTDFTPEVPMEFRVAPSPLDLLDSEVLDGSWSHLQRILKTTKHSLLMVTIKLVGSNDKRMWEGITATELQAIRANPTDSTRDQLVTRLDRSTMFSLFLSTKATPGTLKMWTEKFAGYFGRLLAINKHYGPFWFYRRQVELALGSPDEDAMVDTNLDRAIEKPEMPKVKFAVPRFLVTEWSVTETKTWFGQITYSDIKPHAWEPLEFPPNFPDANVAAFLLKLAVEDERDYQNRNISALVHSSGGRFFRGRYTHMIGNTYLVHVYLGYERLADADVKLPVPGVRVQIKVDREMHDPPQSATTATLSGVVIDTEDDLNDTFVCVCELYGPKLALANGTTDFATYIEYIIDDLPFRRQMKAISELQRISYDGTGPDVKSLIFNHSESGQIAPLSEKLSAAESDYFTEALNRGFPFPADNSQLQACLDTCDSESGMTTIVGPPGCGKTEIAMRIGFGHASLGRRIMYTAPTNAAVHTLVDKFIEHNANLGDLAIPDDDWVLFTGSHCRIGKASKLRQRQTDDDGKVQRLNNTYVEYLRDAASRQKNPRYEQTMGHKLLLKIKKWATDQTLDINVAGKENLYQLSKKYLEVEENLRYYDNASAKKARADQMVREELLGCELLKRVKFVFCTMSSSAHDMILESGVFDAIIVDEAARETRAGIAVFLAALHGRYKHITWSGDHMQGGGVISGSSSNTGYNILARNVFEQLSQVLNKKPGVYDTTPTGAFTLKSCHRMSQALMDWSSNICYGGQVVSTPAAGQWNMPLRNTLAALWSERLPVGFRGSYEQICFDVTGDGIESKQAQGSTSRHNTTEAEHIAYWIVELLDYSPPANTADKLYVRVKGVDICASSNFVNQVSEMRRSLMKASKDKSPYIQEQVKDVLLMLETTGLIQGKERPISFYCTVIAVGHARLGPNEDLPIGFVANVKSFNVSMTRQRLARYMFGAFRLFAQAIRDKRRVAHKFGEFFGYVKHMETSGFILTLEQAQHWMAHRQKPSAAASFSKSLQARLTYDEKPMERPKPGNTSGMHDIASKPATTTKGNAYKQAPANTKYGGKRDNKGNLLDTSRVEKKPVSRGKRSGKKFKDNKRDPGGDDGAAGAAATAA